MKRITIVASALVVTIVALLAGRLAMDELPSDMAEILAMEQKWLVGAAILYVITFLSAWHFRTSVSLSATRMLAWAVAAYITLSHGVDIIGAYGSEIPSIFGLERGGLERPVLLGVQVRLFGLTAILILAIVAIAVGFESTDAEHE